MEKIILNIKEDGYITCKVVNKFGKEKYINYHQIKDNILNIQYKGISLLDDVLKFKNNNYEVIINKTTNNKDVELDILINKLKEEYKIRKQKELKKKKVERRNAIITVTSIGLGTIIALTAFMKWIEGTKDEPDEPEITTSDFTTANNNLEDTPIEPIDYDNTLTSDDTLTPIDTYDYKYIELDHSFENYTDTTRYLNCKENYFDKIQEIAWEYGIDPRIMLAIATKESGYHIINDKANDVGLMQISSKTWDNKTITAFNYRTKQNDCLEITREKLYDLEFNIRVGCMCMQQCLKNSNYDLKIAIQMYNYGIGNITKIFREVYNNSDFSLPRDLTNYDDEWLNYRDLMQTGNSTYLEDILAYIEDTSNLECLRGDQIIQYSVNNIAKNYSY